MNKPKCAVGVVVRRDSLGFDFEHKGHPKHMSWQELDRRVADGSVIYDGPMSTGSRFTYVPPTPTKE